MLFFARVRKSKPRKPNWHVVLFYYNYNTNVQHDSPKASSCSEPETAQHVCVAVSEGRALCSVLSHSQRCRFLDVRTKLIEVIRQAPSGVHYKGVLQNYLREYCTNCLSQGKEGSLYKKIHKSDDNLKSHRRLSSAIVKFAELFHHGRFAKILDSG